MAKAAEKEHTDEGDRKAAEFPLLEYLDELVDDLRRHVSGALKEFDVDAIHDSRVSTRRLKAALDLLAPVLWKESSEPFANVLKKLRRRLGPLRDQDVMLEHLGELMKVPQYGSAGQWLSDRLKEERVAAREKASRKSTPASVLARLGTWWGLREEVAEAREAITSLLAESLHLQLDAFIEQADLISRQETHGAAKPEPANPAPTGVPHPPQAPAPTRRQDPHELRIAGKALRYTLDMARQQGHALPADVAKSFKKMQESLGMWHDYVVLTEKSLTLSTQAMLAHHDASMQGAVLDLARWTMRRASQELGKFAALWARKGPGLTPTIRSAFPLSRSLQEAQQAQVEAEKIAAKAESAEEPVEKIAAKGESTELPPEKIAPKAESTDLPAEKTVAKVETVDAAAKTIETPTEMPDAVPVIEPKMDPDPLGSEETPSPATAAPAVPATV
jgi:CHAD domain-containing protein